MHGTYYGGYNIKIVLKHRKFRCTDLDDADRIPEPVKPVIIEMINELNQAASRKCVRYPAVLYLIFMLLVFSFLVALTLKEKYVLIFTAASILLIVAISCWHSSASISFLEDIEKVVFKYRPELSPYYRIMNNFRATALNHRYDFDTNITLVPCISYGNSNFFENGEHAALGHDRNAYYMSNSNIYQSPDFMLNYIQNRVNINKSASEDEIGPQFVTIKQYDTNIEDKPAKKKKKRSTLRQSKIKFYQYRPSRKTDTGLNNTQSFANIEEYKTLNSVFNENDKHLPRELRTTEEDIADSYPKSSRAYGDKPNVGHIDTDEFDIEQQEDRTKSPVTLNNFLTGKAKPSNDETMDIADNNRFRTSDR